MDLETLNNIEKIMYKYSKDEKEWIGHKFGQGKVISKIGMKISSCGTRFDHLLLVCQC